MPHSAAMATGDTARLYHRLSSYRYLTAEESPDPYLTPPADHPLVVQDFVSLVPGRRPPHWKVYAGGLPTTVLPRRWKPVEVSATHALAGLNGRATTAVDLPGLARLLHLSAGVVRVRDAKPPYTGQWPFRAAGSAGGRFPLELYVSAQGVAGLPDGVHWFDPAGHALVQVGPPARGGGTALIVTGVPWRTGWKYAERGFRHIYWDAGSMLAQTLVLAESSGFGPRLWTCFPDDLLADLVGADGIQEFPLAIVGLGPDEPAIEPGGEAVGGSIGDDPIEFPLVTLAQRAGSMDSLGVPWPAVPPMAGPVPPSDDLDTVILRRGSTRIMDAGATVDGDVFRFALASSLRGATTPQFVAVHAVSGVEPGIYRWPDLDRPVRREYAREEMLLACWDQNLGRDAAFVVISAIDLETVDDRGYREAQLEAGIIEGRLHLAAYSLGIGASGMSFLDPEIEPLLGVPLGALLLTCVGVPTYPGRAGGMPGEPALIITPPSGDTPRAPVPPAT